MVRVVVVVVVVVCRLLSFVLGALVNSHRRRFEGCRRSTDCVAGAGRGGVGYVYRWRARRIECGGLGGLVILEVFGEGVRGADGSEESSQEIDPERQLFVGGWEARRHIFHQANEIGADELVGLL